MRTHFFKYIRTFLCLVLLGGLFSKGEAGSLAQTVGLQSLLSPAAVDEAVQVELIGEYAGEVSAVAVAGKNAYIGFKKKSGDPGYF